MNNKKAALSNGKSLLVIGALLLHKTHHQRQEISS